jgi:hypothetical protein
MAALLGGLASGLLGSGFGQSLANGLLNKGFGLVKNILFLEISIKRTLTQMYKPDSYFHSCM